ncbi:hypothetical protein Dda_6749 [Drechslerella dactyloides]|uniref:von Willebrand domain containing protein n=1 Tax=Drechslerella dactyloides TaxID=74499 RepID=A0AAD6NHP5_DREDA|nr:hypothetical protein Dda_6749 [Drechslerella dactyloides]
MRYIDGKACCGVYYIPIGRREPESLPLLSLTTEITLYPTYSRTILKQHFKNPSQKDEIAEANYVFPLHTTQTITSFTCLVGEDKKLNGIVQSKPKAKATYDEAISRGETAGLLSWSASDVWQTKLGNIPAGASVEVIITCVAQLQHDSEKDAIRFNLPTYIASRYGIPPKDVHDGGYSFRPGKRGSGSWQIIRGTNNWVDIDGGMKINVFVDMDSPVQMVEAPAHPTNLRMGTHSLSDSSSEEFDPKKAVLSLSSDTTALDKDFVVLVKTARSGFPSAVAQRHPTKDAVSMMLTLVPKFNLPISRPEVVFICDRSGSMSGNETQLRKALAVFLQSLPVGCKFNICSFGSSHSFLWKKSRAYNGENLKEAQDHVASFEANMGGTEMYPPVKDAIERRYKDINLELLLLTDGDIWQRDQLMDYVREQCKAKTVRMFTLGIGNGISHALIDGLASVGGGYSQVVQLEEKLDSKVVRMLRAALAEHVSDYTLEFPGGAQTAAEEDDYDMIGDVETSKKSAPEKAATPAEKPKKISLFDTSAESDPPPDYPVDNTDEARWAHLPPLPKLPERLQSPNVIPPLFPFSRTNAYVVFSPAPKTLPSVACLHAKTLAGDDLELEIPVLRIDDGKDVCQLAARSFLQELEDGKGYLHDGVLAAEGFTQEKQESKWDEITEREGVRWGEGYGVASKWTSFVAVEEKTGKAQPEADRHMDLVVDQGELAEGYPGNFFSAGGAAPKKKSRARGASPMVGLKQVTASGGGGPRSSSFASSIKSSSEYKADSIILPYKAGYAYAQSAQCAPVLLSSGRSSSFGFIDGSQDNDLCGIMRDNINKTTERGQQFNQLTNRTGDLSANFSSLVAGPMSRKSVAPRKQLASMAARPSGAPMSYGKQAFQDPTSRGIAQSSEPAGFSNFSTTGCLSERCQVEEDDDDSEEGDEWSIRPDRTKCRRTSGEEHEDESLFEGDNSDLEDVLLAAPPPPPAARASAAMHADTMAAAVPLAAYSAAYIPPPMLSRKRSSSPPEKSKSAKAPVLVQTAEDRIHALIMLQSFTGSFTSTADFAKIVEASFKNSSDVLTKLKDLAAKLGVNEEVVATWIAIITFQDGEGHGSEKDTWELVVEKAVMWLDGEGKNDDAIKQEIARVIKG